MEKSQLMRPLDLETLRQNYINASPFPFIKIENFLEPAFAQEVAAAYPSFDNATKMGRTFKAVNERRKVQVTDSTLFPPAVARLNELIASPAFLSDLSYITGMPNVLADPELIGGGMHITGPGGRLDVHVDFNYIAERRLHRRLNLLLYLNPVWEKTWGGNIQLWDKEVKECKAEFTPALNRCVIFETSDISYHGVTPIAPESPHPRISFAAYYYTREAPAHWKGESHSTIFKARPEEKIRRYVLMPTEMLQRQLTAGVNRVKREVKKLVGAG